MTEVFREGEAPTEICNRHGSYWDMEVAEAAGEGEAELAEAVAEAAEEAAGAVTRETGTAKKRNPLRRWLKKVFGADKDEKKEEGNRPP
jgi:hypothetical protein